MPLHHGYASLIAYSPAMTIWTPPAKGLILLVFLRSLSFDFYI